MVDVKGLAPAAASLSLFLSLGGVLVLCLRTLSALCSPALAPERSVIKKSQKKVFFYVMLASDEKTVDCRCFSACTSTVQYYGFRNVRVMSVAPDVQYSTVPYL